MFVALEVACPASVSADWLPNRPHTVPVASHNFNEVTSVNVTFRDRVDDVLCSGLHFLLAYRQHLHFEVVANELVVENRSSQLRARTLDTIGELVVRANSIVAIDNAFA